MFSWPLCSGGFRPPLLFLLGVMFLPSSLPSIHLFSLVCCISSQPPFLICHCFNWDAVAACPPPLPGTLARDAAARTCLYSFIPSSPSCFLLSLFFHLSFPFFLFFFVCVSISQRSQLISMSVNVKSFKKGLQIDFFSSGGTRVLSDSTGSSGDPWYCYPSHGFSNIYFSWTSQWDLHIKAAHSYLIGKKDPKTQLLWIFIWRWCHIVGRN